MPISSGANGWPNSYWGQQQSTGGTSTVMVQETVMDQSPPRKSPPPPYHKGGGGGGKPEPEPGCCGGGGGGCFGGASNRRYSKGPNGELIYNNPGTPCKRICACILGLLLLLLLLGLILGLIFGLLPYLARRNTAATIDTVYPGGYFQNGIYYYPVPDPYDRHFFYNGPGIPCNPYNNNSDIQAAFDAYVESILNPSTTVNTATATVTTTTSTATAATVTTTPTTPIPALTTVPNCADVTTSFVETWNYTQVTTMRLLTTSIAGSGNCVISFLCFFASVLISVLLRCY